MRKAHFPENVASVGPYSPAIEADGFVFLSGQTPFDSVKGKLVEGGIKEQTVQCFANLSLVLKAAGLTMDNVLKVNVFLTDMKNFKDMNGIYEKQFQKPFPARSTVAVKELPLGAMVEIEMVAKR